MTTAEEAIQNRVTLPVEREFSLRDTLFCGQCFRWTCSGDTEEYVGMIQGTAVAVSQQGEQLICRRLSLDNTPLEPLCRSYFDLDTDYAQLRLLCRCHPALTEAVQYAGGIRILRQPSWEALATFILSQNNNIKRITGLVERLCTCFGQPVPCSDGVVRYRFPSVESLTGLTAEALAPVRCGFRAKYLVDSVERILSGQLSLPALDSLSSPEAMEALMQIHGVGPKVAQCALLFGWHKLDCLPRDVWINRAMEKLFPEGFPAQILPYAGVAQQYLFHYARMNPERFT